MFLAENIATQYKLMMEEGKEKKKRLTVAIIGAYEVGKTQLALQCSLLGGGIDRRALEAFNNRLNRDMSGFKGGSFAYGSYRSGYQTQLLHNSESLGFSTLNVFSHFETAKSIVQLITTPGTTSFHSLAIQGSSMADVVLLVVSVGRMTEEQWGMTRERALVALGQGVQHMIVVCNQMDTLRGDEEKEETLFDELLRDRLIPMLTAIGWRASMDIPPSNRNVSFIPVSAIGGDCLVESPHAEHWWNKRLKKNNGQGYTLFQLLDKIAITIDRSVQLNKPLRMSVYNHVKIGGIGWCAVGSVLCGSIEKNQKIFAEASSDNNKATTKIKSIDWYHTDAPVGVAGDLVGVNYMGGSLYPLNILSENSHSGLPALEFIARIIVMHPEGARHALRKAEEVQKEKNDWSEATTKKLKHLRESQRLPPKVIRIGYSPTAYCGTANTGCKIAQIIARTNPKTWQIMERRPPCLKQGQAGLVRVRLLKPIVVEEFKNFARLGRIILQDNHQTIAIGMITRVYRSMPEGLREGVVLDDAVRVEGMIKKYGELLFSVDGEGNTILHLALMHKAIHILPLFYDLLHHHCKQLEEEEEEEQQQEKKKETKETVTPMQLERERYMRYGYVLSKRNNEGITPFHIAWKNIPSACVDLLIHGAEIVLPPSKKGLRQERRILSLSVQCLMVIQGNRERYSNLDDVLPPDKFLQMIFAAFESFLHH